MSGVRLNDTQLAILLRAHLPAEARADLRQSIAAEVARTQQHRPLPWIAGIVSDPDPLVRRRLLLVAAAALLLALAAGAALVGSQLLDRDRDLFHDLALDPTPDVEGFVQAAYSANYDLPALHLSFGEGLDVFYDGRGTIRVAGRDGLIEMITPTSWGHIDTLRGERVWVVSKPEQPQAMDQFIQMTGFEGPGRGPACLRNWEYLGVEQLLGRPTHHVRCQRVDDVGAPVTHELWIDHETGLVLRALLYPVAQCCGSTPGAEEETVTALEIGPQPAGLFVFEPPLGLRTISEAEWDCANDPGSPVCDLVPSPSPTAAASP